MNVRELITALKRLDPDLPVVIENQNIEWHPEYAELLNVEVSDEFKEDYTYDGGGRAYKPRSWWSSDDPRRDQSTNPVVLLTQELPPRPTIDGEVVPPALPAADPT